MALDTRIPVFDVTGSAGTTEQWVFTDADDTEITSLSIYVGGTVDDLDDLTGATEYAASISGSSNEIASVNVLIPEGNTRSALRLVVDGLVQGVGLLASSTAGSGSASRSFSLIGTERTFTIDGRSVTGIGNIDGGTPTTSYGSTTPIDGGTP